VAAGFRVEDFDIESADALLPGVSSTGVLISNAARVVLRRVSVLAGDGAPGIVGAEGQEGAGGDAEGTTPAGLTATCSSGDGIAGSTWPTASSCGSRGGNGGNGASAVGSGTAGLTGQPTQNIDNPGSTTAEAGRPAAALEMPEDPGPTESRAIQVPWPLPWDSSRLRDSRPQTVETARTASPARVGARWRRWKPEQQCSGRAAAAVAWGAAVAKGGRGGGGGGASIGGADLAEHRDVGPSDAHREQRWPRCRWRPGWLGRYRRSRWRGAARPPPHRPAPEAWAEEAEPEGQGALAPEARAARASRWPTRVPNRPSRVPSSPASARAAPPVRRRGPHGCTARGRRTSWDRRGRVFGRIERPRVRSGPARDRPSVATA